MPQKKSDKAAAAKVTVAAIENKDRSWTHRGQAMKPGDKAEVTEQQAAKLKEAGLIK